MIDEKIIKLCRNEIKKKILTLDDIPYDLANTIVNIYYKYFLLGEDLIRNPIPEFVTKYEDIFKGTNNFIKEFYSLQFRVKTIPDLIKNLREFKKENNVFYYDLWLEVSYDILKYDIKFAFKKTGLRRAIERYFKKKKVNEIPHLIDIINLKNNKNDFTNRNYLDKTRKTESNNQKKHRNDFTMLMVAANEGEELAVLNHIKIFKEDVNEKGKKGLTPLMLAANNGYLNIVRILINYGADVNSANDDGYTALMLASNKGFYEIVHLLINEGAELDSQDKSGYTALILAASKGHKDIVQYLIESGANPCIKDYKGNDAKVYAILNGYEELALLLSNFC